MVHQCIKRNSSNVTIYGKKGNSYEKSIFSQWKMAATGVHIKNEAAHHKLALNSFGTRQNQYFFILKISPLEYIKIKFNKANGIFGIS